MRAHHLIQQMNVGIRCYRIFSLVAVNNKQFRNEHCVVWHYDMVAVCNLLSESWYAERNDHSFDSRPTEWTIWTFRAMEYIQSVAKQLDRSKVSSALGILSMQLWSK